MLILQSYLTYQQKIAQQADATKTTSVKKAFISYSIYWNTFFNKISRTYPWSDIILGMDDEKDWF